MEKHTASIFRVDPEDERATFLQNIGNYCV
jgi:hypothetical protein